MANVPLKRWLLVNYAGYPYAPNSLMPDNGLANLAAVLHDAGCEAAILDFATVSVMSRFASPALCARLSRTWDSLTDGRGGRAAWWTKAQALLRLHRAELVRARLQSRMLAELSDRVVEQVRRDGVQAVGFKLWNGDGLAGSAVIAQAIRRRCPDVRIFGGGPHVDVFMERLADHFEVFDGIVFGEGENTIQRLAEAGNRPEAYANVPNLIYRRNGDIVRTREQIVERLDDIPMPIYDPEVYPAMAGDDKVKILVVDESRGCRNNCAFCIHPVKSHHNLRTKSTARLLAEVERMRTLYGIDTFRFAGSCTPYELLNDFAREVLQRKVHCAYASFAHVREAEQADFHAIRASGCLSLFFGIESGSQQVLDAMRKGIKAPRIAEAVSAANAAGIFTVGSLIYPAPGDTAETAAETLAVLAQARPSALCVQAPLIIPRTDWFDHPTKYGIRFNDRERYLEKGMRWKIKMLMPPAFWSSLPVTIDGRPFKRLLAETTRLVGRLEQQGYTTAVSDDTYLMSVRAGMDVAEFRDLTRKAFFTGDANQVRAVVRRINAGSPDG